MAGESPLRGCSKVEDVELTPEGVLEQVEKALQGTTTNTDPPPKGGSRLPIEKGPLRY